MLSKHLISTVLTQIPVFVLGVFSGVFSTRILGDQGKGIFTLFQANYHLFVLIFSFSIQTGIVYFISSKKIKESVVIGMSLFVFLLSSFGLLLILIIGYYFNLTQWFLPNQVNSFSYLISLFALFFITFLNSIIASVFQAHSFFKSVNLVSVINSVINLSIFAFLFFFIRESKYDLYLRFDMVLYSTIGVLLLNLLIWLLLYFKHIKILPEFSFNLTTDLRKFLLYNTSVYFGMFVNFFNYRLDLWIVNHYLSELELSYYSLAANINQIILILAVTIGSVLLPNLASKSQEERNQIFIRVSRICAVIFAGIMMIAFILANDVIPFMYGISFVDTILPFKILLPGILFSSITQLFSIYIVSADKNRFNIIACSLGLVVTILFDLVLIPIYGINGAAIATCISYFVIFLSTFVFVFRLSGKTTLNFFIPNWNDVKLAMNYVFKR